MTYVRAAMTTIRTNRIVYAEGSANRRPPPFGGVAVAAVMPASSAARGGCRDYGAARGRAVLGNPALLRATSEQ
jgi:hypothetical protein